MNKERKNLIESNEISEIRKYNLGEYEQKVLIDGKLKENPIVLILHGGPGSPIPFSVGCRGMFPEFTDKFTIVCWDQLGCGANNYVIDDSFHIDTFVDMTVELIKKLKEDFPDNKFLLFGTSWGSILAAKSASLVPNLIDTVITYGQITKDLFFSDEVYETLEKVNLSNKAKKRFDEIRLNKTHSVEDVRDMSVFINKYTEGYQAKSDKKMPIGKIIRGFITSPDYSFSDFIAVVKNGYSKNNSLWEELISIDLTSVLENIKVPYMILQGSTDIVTSTNSVADFVNKSKNPNLSYKIIERSGHMPSAEGIDEILKESIILSNNLS